MVIQIKNLLGIAVYFYQDKIDPNLFKEWFIDTIENFEIINLNLFTLEESKVNSFIITPEYILKANDYKALIKNINSQSTRLPFRTRQFQSSWLGFSVTS
ncbi:MAG: hypothetical protein M5T52_24645 [Ignavibacteriaceae bacterium]|nr:hypothetical protein [Ignavibacteriaceae bacterium]